MIILLLLWLIAVLEVVFVYLQSELIVSNVEYSAVQDEISVVKQENMILNETLLTRESLGYLEPLARKKGFVQASYIYLK